MEDEMTNTQHTPGPTEETGTIMGRPQFLHSKGPWRSTKGDSVKGGTIHTISFGTGGFICSIEAGVNSDRIDPVCEANARLIAAAPDLLAALQLMQAALTEYDLRDVKKRYSLCVADAAASNAIARATGAV